MLYYQQSVLAAGTWTIRIDVTRPELTGHSSGHLSKTSPNFLLLPVMHRNYHRGHFTRELNIMLSSEGIAYYWLYWIELFIELRRNIPQRCLLLWVNTELCWYFCDLQSYFISNHYFCHRLCIWCRLTTGTIPSCRLWPGAGHHRSSGQESRTLYLGLRGHLSCCCSQVNKPTHEQTKLHIKTGSFLNSATEKWNTFSTGFTGFFYTEISASRALVTSRLLQYLNLLQRHWNSFYLWILVPLYTNYRTVIQLSWHLLLWFCVSVSKIKIILCLLIRNWKKEEANIILLLTNSMVKQISSLFF